MYIQTKHLILTLLFVSLFSTPLFSQQQTESKTQIEQTTTVKSKTYKLKGFKQACCSGLVEYSLKEVEGYIKSKANVSIQELTVWFDTAKCTEEDIKKAINKTPYKILN